MRLAAQRASDRAGAASRRPALRPTTFAMRCLACGLAALGRLAELHAGAAGLGETDGDGLLRRARAVLAFADVVNLLADEFTGLRAGRLSGARLFSCAFEG